MRYVGSLALLFTSAAALCQSGTFTDNAAFWTVARTYPAATPDAPNFVATTTRRHWITGDSLVAGELWSVFVSQATLGGPEQFEGLARQQGELVMGLREDLTVDTLYDFGLEVGDSTHYYIDDWLSEWLHVAEVSSMLIDGVEKRVIHFEEVIDAPAVLQERWIEDIGSIHGPLFPASPVTFATEWPDSLLLTCYGRNDTVLWDHPDYDGCEVNILLGTDELLSWSPLRVFPNPSNGPLSVEWPGHRSFRIRVLDALGSCVFQDLAIGSRADLALMDAAPGVYVVIVEALDGELATARWVKK